MKNTNKVALWMAKKNTFGGAERRLLRIFSSLSRAKELGVDILIKKISMDESGVNRIQSFVEDSNTVHFFSKQIDACRHILRTHYGWLCLTDVTRRSVLIAVLSKVAGTKVLFCSVDSSGSSLIFNSRKQRLLFKTLVWVADHVDCLYPDGTVALQKEFPRKRVTQTPNSFADLNMFKPSPSKQNIIIFASRLTAGKNVQLYLKAIEDIAQHMRDKKYIALLCGDGDMKLEAEQYISANGFSDVCKCTGYINTADVFPAAKVFCSLQQITNYPSQSLIEAVACGCYCIVTDVRESYKMIDASFGTLIPIDSLAVSQKIVEAMSFSNEKWRSVSEHAREFAEREFTIDSSVVYFKSIFEG